MKILVVEDEKLINKMICTILRNEGHDVDSALGGNQAIEMMSDIRYHFILTDLKMDQGSGEDLLMYMQEHEINIPTIVISANNDVETINEMFNLNIIDFLVKPFSEQILKMKLKNISEYLYPDTSFKLSKSECVIVIDNKRIELSSIEYDLFELLYKFPSQRFTKYDLLNEIWYGNTNMSEKIVEVSISRLRKSLGEYGDCIKNKRGVGYYFEQ